MRIPLAVNLESRDGGVGKDAKVLNGIVESRGQDVPPTLYKRPGVSDQGLIAAGAAQLLYNWNGIKAIIGDTLYSGTVSTIVSAPSSSALGGSSALNPSDKDAAITLSNNNLTATNTSGYKSVRGVAATGKSSGKWFWEVTFAGTSDIAGVANASAALSSFCGNDANGWGFQAGNGDTWHTAGFTNITTALSAGAIIGFALDMDGGTLKIYNAGTLLGTAFSTGLTGTLLPMLSPNGTSNMTANFGSSAFSQAIPTGYTAFNTTYSAGLQFTAVETNPTAATPYLFFKTSRQAFVVNRSGVVSSVTYASAMGAGTYTLTSLTRSGTTATATLSDDVFSVGDSVTIAGASPSNYNGTVTVTGTVAGSAGQNIPITITRAAGTSTPNATTVYGGAHGLTSGSSYAISAAAQADFNGTFAITSTGTSTFTYTMTAGGTETWNPSDVGANITLSGGNLAATIGGGSFGTTSVRGTFSTSGDKWYWEVTVTARDTSVGCDIGVANATASTGTELGSTVNSWSYRSSGQKGNGSTSAYGASYTTGDVIGIALDMSAGTLTFYKNGVSQGQAFSGITGSIYPAVSPCVGTIGHTTTLTANFGATAFSMAIPGGFSKAMPSTATGSPIVTGAATNPTFTYTVSGSPTTPATGTITALGGGGTVPGCPYIDGYISVMDANGVIWHCAQDNPTSWPALTFLTARNENGKGVALGKSLNYLVAWKEYSTEYYYDAQNPSGSPFSPVDNGFTRTGCASGPSVARVSNAHCWISQIREGNRSVHRMDGLQQAEIATPDICRILNADTLATVYAFGIDLKGHPLYLLTLPGSNITLVYDLISQFWTQWTSLTLGSQVSVSSITLSGTIATVTTSTAHGLNDGDPVKISGANQSAYNAIFQAFVLTTTTFNIYVTGNPVTPATGTIIMKPYTETYFKFIKETTYNGSVYFLHESDGHLYQMLPTLYQDAGIPIDLFARTVRLDGGDDDQKKMKKVRFIGDLATEIAGIRFSDDDSATFTPYRLIALDQQPSEIRKCGGFRRRSVEFRHVGNTPLRGEALELEIAK